MAEKLKLQYFNFLVISISRGASMSQPVEAEAVFSTFHFLRNLQLGPKGWSVFIALSWKCLSEPKTPDYWAHSEIMKKIKCYSKPYTFCNL